MQEKIKNSALVICLFGFLFVIVGGGLHLAPGGAFLAAVTGTPLVIYAFRRKANAAPRHEDILPDATRNEVAYVSSKPNKPNKFD